MVSGKLSNNDKSSEYGLRVECTVWSGINMQIHITNQFVVDGLLIGYSQTPRPMLELQNLTLEMMFKLVFLAMSAVQALQAAFCCGDTAFVYFCEARFCNSLSSPKHLYKHVQGDCLFHPELEAYPFILDHTCSYCFCL